MRPLDALAVPLQGTTLIEASAGTGKTYTISTLHLRLLLESRLAVGQILVVTFTNAATAELRARIRRRLRAAADAISTGRLPDDLHRAYDVCRAAQEAALAAVRPAAAAADLDAIARSAIEESGLAPVLHGLGHGVGIEIHELPVLRPTSTDVLVAGNVVTIEPGVYLVGRGGVRIEDLVVVTDDGCDLLTTFTKDLVTLG